MGHRQEQIAIIFSHFHWDHIQGFPSLRLPTMSPKTS